MVKHTHDAPKIAHEWAYVVYDERSGAIRHVHGITIFEGAKSPSQKEGEMRALAAARGLGHPGDHLKVLAVEQTDIIQRAPQRVDLQTLRLIHGENASGRKA